MIAFLPTLGFQEMVVLLLLGILLFGRNLPDVGRTLGRTVSQLRRGFQDFKDQLDRDESVRDLRRTVQQTKQEIARVGAVPRALTDPTAALRDVARQALESAPTSTPTETPPVTPTVTPSGPENESAAEPSPPADSGTERQP